MSKAYDIYALDDTEPCVVLIPVILNDKQKEVRLYNIMEDEHHPEEGDVFLVFSNMGDAESYSYALEQYMDNFIKPLFYIATYREVLALSLRNKNSNGKISVWNHVNSQILTPEDFGINLDSFDFMEESSRIATFYKEPLPLQNVVEKAFKENGYKNSNHDRKVVEELAEVYLQELLSTHGDIYFIDKYRQLFVEFYTLRPSPWSVHTLREQITYIVGKVASVADDVEISDEAIANILLKADELGLDLPYEYATTDPYRLIAASESIALLAHMNLYDFTDDELILQMQCFKSLAPDEYVDMLYEFACWLIEDMAQEWSRG